MPGFLYTFSQRMFLDFTVLNITFDMGAITEALIRKRGCLLEEGY